MTRALENFLGCPSKLSLRSKPFKKVLQLTTSPVRKFKFLRIGLIVISAFIHIAEVWSQGSAISLRKVIARTKSDTNLSRLYYELGTDVYVAKPDSAKQLETATKRPEHARNAAPFPGDLIGFTKMIKAPRYANIMV